MRTIIFSFAILAFAAAGFSQTTVRDLHSTHAAALEKYLSSNKNRRFRQEFVLSDEYLKTVRIDFEFGKTFKPNYSVGDLNGDRLIDFAVLLHRDGEPEWPLDETKTRVDEHSPETPLTLVIFNGLKGGGFRVAFVDDLMGPAASFINIAVEKKTKTLFFGVFETGHPLLFIPAGDGYIIEEEKPR